MIIIPSPLKRVSFDSSPTFDDGCHLGTRTVIFNYPKQIAAATDSLGNYGVLLLTGHSCEDSSAMRSSPRHRTASPRWAASGSA